MLKWGYYAMLAEKVIREIDQMMKDPTHQPFPPKENFIKWLSGLSHPVRSGLLKVLFFGGIYLGVSIVAYCAVALFTC